MKASVCHVVGLGLLVVGLLQAPASAAMSMPMKSPSPSPSPKPAASTPSPSPAVAGTVAIRPDPNRARTAYPWCKTAVTTSYSLEPAVYTRNTTSGEKEFVFAMKEDYGACLDYVKRMGRTDTSLCRSPFYSFMISISEECHEAVMVVNTVQMMMRQDRPSATDTAMYCHSHKGHDTGVPLLKFLAKPTYLQPNTTAPYTKRRFIFTMRVNPREESQMRCKDIRTLCGGDSCMVALSDEEYDICPAYVAKIV